MGLRVSKQLQSLGEREKGGGSLGSVMWTCSEAGKPEATLATALTSSLMTSTPVTGLVLGVGHTLLVAGTGDRVCMLV